MTSEQQILARALTIDNSHERALFLEHACGANSVLRARIEDELRRMTHSQESKVVEPVHSGIRSTMDLPPLTETEGKTIGPYRLLQKLGEGGMGVVYMAEQQQPVRRRVALKIIKPGMDSGQVVARFEAERQALAMMDHQNIARVLDAGTTDSGRPYFVMELVQGIPINDYADRLKLTLRERLDLFVGICYAVQHAHQKGIIHRDLKPSNVLVCIYDGHPIPKVIDFGLAKALQQQTKLTDKTLFTEFGQVLGTVQYMSPEQAMLDSLDIDTRTDIYSLGVMLYELMVGSTPIDEPMLKRHALLQVLQMIREQDPPRPSHRLSSSGQGIQAVSDLRQVQPSRLRQILRGDLDWIIMKALEKDRTRRYDTATSLAVDVQRYLDGEAILARPPSKIYRFQKFVRKNRSLVATSLAILALLVGGVSGTSWFAVKAGLARSAAVAERDRADREASKARSNERDAARQLALQLVAAGTSHCEAGYIRDGVGELMRGCLAAHGDQELMGSLQRLGIAWANQLPHRIAQEGRPSAVVYSPSGRLVVAMRGTVAQIYDAYTGEPSGKAIAHNELISGCAYSPDETRLVTASADQTARIWDVHTGNPVGTTMRHLNRVTGVDIRGDGQQIATCDADSTVRRWDLNGNALGSPLAFAASPTSVTSVKFNRDGSRIITDTGIRDVETSRLLSTGANHTNALSADGARWFAQRTWSSAEIWNAETRSRAAVVRHPLGVMDIDRAAVTALVASDNIGQCLDTNTMNPVGLPMVLDGPVAGGRFSPDGSRIAIFSDGTVRLYRVPECEPLGEPLQHRHMLRALDFSSDGNSILTLGIGGEAQLWSAIDGAKLAEAFKFTGKFVARSMDNTRFVTASDNALLIWNAYNGHSVGVSVPMIGPIVATGYSTQECGWAAFDPRGKWFYTSSGGSLRKWNAATGELHAAEELPKNRLYIPSVPGQIFPGDTPTSIGLTPDGQILVVALGQRVVLFDAEPLQPRMAPIDIDFTVSELVMDSQGNDRALLTGLIPVSVTNYNPAEPHNERKSQIWDVRRGQSLGPMFGHGQDTTIFFHPMAKLADLTKVAFRRFKGAVELKDVRSGKSIGEPYFNVLQLAEFTKDGGHLLFETGSQDEHFAFHQHANLATLAGGTNIDGLKQISRETYYAKLSPDDKYVATANATRSENNSVKAEIRLWDLDSLASVGKSMEHEGNVSALIFSPDGSELTSMSESHLNVWHVPTQTSIESTVSQDQRFDMLVLSPDGSTSVMSQGNGLAELQARFRNEPLQTLWHDIHAFRSMAPSDPGFAWNSRCGLVMRSDLNDGVCEAWNVRTGELIWRSPMESGFEQSFAIHDSGTKFVAGYGDGAYLFDLPSGQKLGSSMELGSTVRHVAFSADGMRVLIAGTEAMGLWDATTGKPLTDVIPFEEGLIAHGNRGITLSRDNSRLAAIGNLGNPWLWDVSTSIPKKLPFSFAFEVPGNGGIRQKGIRVDEATIRFSLSDSLLLLKKAETPEILHIINAASGNLSCPPLQHSQEISCFSATSAGRIATATKDGSVRIWDSKTGGPLGRVMRQDGSVLCVAFSPDGQRIACGSARGEVILWDCRTNTRIGPPLHHEFPVDDLMFGINGKEIWTRTRDEVSIWNPSQGFDAAEGTISSWFVARSGLMLEGHEVRPASNDEIDAAWKEGRRRDPTMSQRLWVDAIARKMTFHKRQAMRAAGDNATHALAFHLTELVRTRLALQTLSSNENAEIATLRKALAALESITKEQNNSAESILLDPRLDPLRVLGDYGQIFNRAASRWLREHKAFFSAEPTAIILPNCLEPAWAPDGLQLACSCPTGGMNRRKIGIVKFDPAKSAASTVESLDVEGVDPAWSPSGEKIVYHGYDGDGYRMPDSVWLYDLKAQKPRRIASGEFPRWSSKGERLFYYSPQASRLLQLSQGKGDAAPTSVLDRELRHRSAAVSPDGQRVALWKRELARFCVVEIESGNETIAVPWSAPDAIPAFSHDGKWIALGGSNIRSAQGTNPGLWLIHLGTNSVTKLLDGSFDYPAWSSDGKWLAFHESYHDTSWDVRTLVLATESFLDHLHEVPPRAMRESAEGSQPVGRDPADVR